MEAKIFAFPFSKVYIALVKKAERKQRTKQEVDQIITWLTGYSLQDLKTALAKQVTVKEFFENAPLINQNANKITGVVCGIRVENIEDPLMQKIRWLDKLIDELAKGKPMSKILRTT